MAMNNVPEMSQVQHFDADALFDELDSTHGDTYDLVVNAGIAARENLDNGRYIIGDLAVHLRKQYGEDTVGRFAEAINCRTASVREYRRICAFWSRPVRRELFEEMPSISYSILRDSIRFKDTGKALDFLRKCADNDWKCERAHIEANKLLGDTGTPEMYKVLDTVMPGHELFALRLGIAGGMDSKFRLVVYLLGEDAK